MNPEDEQLISSGESPRQPTDAYSEYAREYRILIEYKYMVDRIASGLYVMPSLNSTFGTLLITPQHVSEIDTLIAVWNCAIFIRQGPYRHAVFKFDLIIPTKYPEFAPLVCFTSRVYHPQVDLESGSLNIQRAFPNWNHETDYLWQVLNYVKRVFYKIDTIEPLNQAAADMFVNNRQEFQEEARKCAEESAESCVHLNGMKFTKYDDTIHGSIQSAILDRVELMDSNSNDNEAPSTQEIHFLMFFILLLAPFLFLFGLLNLLWRSIRPCPFCAISKGKLKTNIVDQNDHCVCFVDRHPAGEHHYLVIPRQHVRDIGVAINGDMPIETVEAMIEMGRQVQKKHGPLVRFDMVFSRPIFAMIPHLHLHVVSEPLTCNWLRAEYLVNGIFHVTAQQAIFDMRQKRMKKQQ
ncbi:hypothetical protein PROFUN_13423 [Planoprotostelium fungivorum]|uniref:Uncharacterized protein n=1 Tax=Planoprotostelium fungivorum TaxID=1890364 RepID=A0A2P6N3Z7_9EUKA|nr:hypothetical protein PROFUN_13423 [Planoprotostelium fungivorum]